MGKLKTHVVRLYFLAKLLPEQLAYVIIIAPKKIWSLILLINLINVVEYVIKDMHCQGITFDALNLAKAVPNVKAIWPSH